ncbi:unnamed protein product [Ilex paraguariensis]|uniref:Formin-like protein n=1 Tax=Ilex paraguariensis TaxID=185542 RepID=A0ABC8V2D4_9AQUA
MDERRVRSVVLFVVLLCVLVEGNRKIAETFFSDEVPWNIQEIDEDTAEQVWVHCRKELKESTEAVENFDLYLPQAATNPTDSLKSEVALLTKRIIHKVITDLRPEVKHIIGDCLRKKNLLSHNSGKEDVSKNWFIKCQELLFDWTSVPRRCLVSKQSQHLAPSPAQARRRKHHHFVASPAPAPGPATASPTYAPAPSYPVPASSPSPISPSPVEAPEPSLPQDLNDSPPPPAVFFPPPRPPDGPHIPSQKNRNNPKYTTATIAASSVAAVALIALFLLCCLKGSKNKIGPRDGQRDEKPLLNICSSDLSAGSSQKSLSVGNSNNKDFRTSSIVNNLSISADIHKSSLGEDQSSEAAVGASGNTSASLPLPPGKTAPPPPGPPPPPPKPPAPSPPPPPKVGRPPPNPPKPSSLKKPSPLGPHHQGSSSLGEGNDSHAPKTKLKPFFWDKVLANPDHSMVWHEIKAGSFQFNEEMIESLFGYASVDKNKNERRKDGPSFDSPTQYIQIIDSKKSQNLSIVLKALNVTTEEVCDALKEGNELPVELIQTLLKMAPTTDEELKLRLYSGDLSQLGPAERFLKVLVDIPFAFKRLESLLFMCSLQEEVSSIKESFATIEVACKELRNSRLFLKLLEAVLKTGNRMNDGTFRGGAQAFKLDTLLKLSDVKGTDGKTTLLHFVVQEIIRSEGIRAARRLRESQSMSSVRTEDLVEESTQETAEHYRGLGLQVVSGLSNELENVRKAALIDCDILQATVSNLGHLLLKNKEFLNTEMNSEEQVSEFHDALASFVQHAEGDIMWLLEEEKRIITLVKSTGDYFHGNAGKDEGLHLFMIVRDFLIIVDKVCKEVRNSAKMPMRIPRKEAPSASPSQESRQQSLPDIHQRLFPAIRERQSDDFSSDDESSSP